VYTLEVFGPNRYRKCSAGSPRHRERFGSVSGMKI
jgi:hypothetical protein